ncbi:MULTISPECIES: TetR/AcrR family transcriptional regulator [unclassified Curtobacterium]|uniref:TetR/AcrR family transcriptional regulator n=1 Tax=unclassified Curtobacterium TaxID=257496 RepID=UPI0008DCFD99|nr:MULTISPECIES: TetR/AcrR family transcriptional regulator [unclassified Curtobacterium]OIH98634.1 TetR family transcriptional regulator [Curtobacterium sp. MCBA15_003]OII32359.1 TetR family transcriptional regulator [Curtobacterium sp. MMLR14_006]
MARWEPGARERLVMAAAELFAEHGYDETTVTQIAERAGVTKSTLFRHFPDKREILVAGQATLSALLAEGVADAGESATPMQAVASGLRRASSVMQPWNRTLGPSMAAAIAANAELRERSMLKSAGLAVALSDALEARGTTPTTARVAAELGVLAFERGYTAWTDAPDGTEGDLEHHVIAALEELRVATAALG